MVSIMRCLVLDRGDHYYNHYASIPEYLQQLRILLSEVMKNNDEVPYPFAAWFNMNRSFNINGTGLQALSSNFIEGI
jgi:hypothetical protein